MGILGIKDILKELEKPGLDPRKAAKVFEFDPNVKSIKNLNVGMILPGIVNNITAFGCFVDLGNKRKRTRTYLAAKRRFCIRCERSGKTSPTRSGKSN